MKKLFAGLGAFCFLLPVYATVYTTDQCMEGSASSSSQFSTSYAASYGFDDVIDTYNGWYTVNNTVTGWLQYEFPEAKTIKKYVLKTRGYSTAHLSAPRDWKFEGWDGVSWVVLDTRTGINNWTTLDSKSYEISNDVAYSKYRINISANNGSTFTGIAEMEMFEEAVFVGDGGHESIWYFGFGAGLDFRYDPPLALGGSAMNQWEGCASIADDEGNLLFYTNGVCIWNSNHDIMPNGNSLYGSNTSTQSGIIVPYPGNDALYYVFTLDRDGHLSPSPPSRGLCYTLVDMSLDGGLGDVVVAEKNVELNNPSTEKITAIRHANGTDVWVLTHGWGSNKFLAYLITASGINTTPVESAAGLVHYDNLNGWQAAGYMKVSPSGTRIALNILGLATTQVFDFNPLTGQVSNPITLTNSRTQAYGLEFSPDETKLYTTAWEHNNILQYDLSLGDEASIAASETEIGISDLAGGSNYNGLGALQLGPDGNIYVAKDANGIGGNVNEWNSFLGIISLPDEAAGAKAGPVYTDKGIYLGNYASGIGLPGFIQSYFIPLPVEITEFKAFRDKDHSVHLLWQTLTERNNDYFLLLKSTDRINYEPLVRIGGAGNSSTMIQYEYTDECASGDGVYYRLQQFDYDGKMNLAGECYLPGSSLSDFKLFVYPNPFIDIVSLEMSGLTPGELLVELRDMSGKLLFNKRFEVNSDVLEYSPDLSEIESGIYVLVIRQHSAENNMQLLKK